MNELFGVDVRKQLFPKKRKKKCLSNGGILGNLVSEKASKEEKLSTKVPMRRKRQNFSVLANISCNVNEKENSYPVGNPSMLTFNGSSMGGPGVLGEVGFTGANQKNVAREDFKDTKVIKGQKYTQTSVLETLSRNNTTNVPGGRSSRRKREANKKNKQVISVSSNQITKKEECFRPRVCLGNERLGSNVSKKKMCKRKKVKPTGDDEPDDSCLANIRSNYKEAGSSVETVYVDVKERDYMQGSEKYSQYSVLANENTNHIRQIDELIFDCCPVTLFLDTDSEETADVPTETILACAKETKNKESSPEIMRHNIPQESPCDGEPCDDHGVDLLNTDIIEEDEQYETREPVSSTTQHTHVNREGYTKQLSKEKRRQSNSKFAKKKLEPDGEKAMSRTPTHVNIELIDTAESCINKSQNISQAKDRTLKKQHDLQSVTTKQILTERKIEPPECQVNDMKIISGSLETQNSSKWQENDEYSNSGNILNLTECKDTAEKNSTRGFEILHSINQERKSKCLDTTNIPAIERRFSSGGGSCKRNLMQSEEASSTPDFSQGGTLVRECSPETNHLHAEENVVRENNLKAIQYSEPKEESATRHCSATGSIIMDAPGIHVLEIDYLVPFSAPKMSHPSNKGSPKVEPLSETEGKVLEEYVNSTLSPVSTKKSSKVNSGTLDIAGTVESRFENRNLEPSREKKPKNERKSEKVKNKKSQRKVATKLSIQASLGNQRKSMRQRIKTDRYSPPVESGNSRSDGVSQETEMDASISLNMKQEMSSRESMVSEKIGSESESHALRDPSKGDVASSEMKRIVDTSGSQRKSSRQRIKTDRYSPPIESANSRSDQFSQETEMNASKSLNMQQEMSSGESMISEKIGSESESHALRDLSKEDAIASEMKRTIDTLGSQRKSSRQRIKTDRYSPPVESRNSRDGQSSEESEIGAPKALNVEQEVSSEETLIANKSCSRSEPRKRRDLMTEDSSGFEKKDASPEPAANNDNKTKDMEVESGGDDTIFCQNPESPVWSDIQLDALRKAYISVDPRSDQFWSEISQNVHGKSEEECGDKWFDLVETPARENKKKKARKNDSKVQALKKVADADEDDIFNATPMKSYEDQEESYENSSALFNVDLSPIIDEGPPRKDFTTEYDDAVDSGPLVSRAGYKSYIQSLRRDISKAKKVDRKRKRPITRTKPCVLSDKVGHGGLEVDGCLTPGGTLRVRTYDHDQEEDDFFGSDSEEE